MIPLPDASVANWAELGPRLLFRGFFKVPSAGLVVLFIQSVKLRLQLRNIALGLSVVHSKLHPPYLSADVPELLFPGVPVRVCQTV